jgi:hypothetical protein
MSLISSYQGTPDLGSSIFVTIYDAQTDAVIVARSNSGITQVATGSGFYVYSGASFSALAYAVLWDEGTAGSGGGEVVQAVSAVAPGIVADQNAALDGLTFLIKRNDTLPSIQRQFKDTSGNVIAINNADTVKFTMRASNDTVMTGSPKVHASAVIVDAANGIVRYDWVAADTDTSTTQSNGQEIPYAAEFELTRLSDGKIETFPQNGYILVTMPRDLDPGINP